MPSDSPLPPRTAHRPRKRGVATLREVAAGAGVSIATASRALADPRRVGLELGDRVARVAAQIGYVRNGAAGALASSRSRLVGILMPRTLDEGHAAMLASVEASLGVVGYGSLVVLGPTTEGFRRMLSAGVEGLALLGAELSEEALAQAIERRVSIAGLGAGASWGGELDIGRGMARVGAYLAGLGHRRFALMGSQERSGVWCDCTRALESVVAEHSNATLLQASAPSFDFDGAAMRVREWLRQPTPPTAIVCGDDVLAAGALRGCAHAGVAVPTHVSVVGVGDFAASRYTEPGLTTVRLPWASAAQKVVARLLSELSPSEELAAFAKAPSPVARLVLRASSGAAPTGGS